MDTETLVEAKVSDSIELIKVLDKDPETKPFMAFWYYYVDSETWQFLVCSPKLDKLLPKEEHIAYREIAEALNGFQANSLVISEVKVSRSTDPLISAVRMLIDTGPEGLGQAYFVNNTLNGIFIPAMIVVRSSATHKAA